MTAADPTYRLPAASVFLLLVLVALGLVSLAIGFLVVPDRTWMNLLLVGNYLVGLGLGALLFVAFHHVCGARWSLPLLRIPEAMTAVLPVAAAALLLVFFCRPSLYSWSVSSLPADSESPLKHFWLNRPFFLLRALVYLSLWLAFARALVRTSRPQNETEDPAPTGKSVQLSAAFLVVFGVTCWLSSYDWVMSLDPDWASTMFAVYNFAGIFLSGLAAIILLVLWLQRFSPLRTVIKDGHLHDLGTLLFSFSCFWMYTWFCQYMLIWYVNIPEETAYYRQRWQGNGMAIVLVNLTFNWAIPFIVLLFRSAKQTPLVLGSVALLVLFGRWIDLFLMVMPSVEKVVPVPGLIEAGILMGAFGVFAMVVFRTLLNSRSTAWVITQPEVR